MTEQHTISRTVDYEGVGLHSGQNVRLQLKPGEVGSGLQFIRSDLPSQPRLSADAESVHESPRGTRLEFQGCEILTPEHLLAACAGLGIDNMEVHLHGPELPIADGSAMPFVELLRAAGRLNQHVTQRPYYLTEPLFLQDGASMLLLRPAERLHITYVASFPAPVGTQVFEYTPGADDFSEQVAPARTFGFSHEIEALRARGLALGGSLDNALVITADGYSTPLRFSNEIVRHKTLDLIGDLALLGRPLQAHIVAVRTSHAMHARMLKELWAREKA